MTTMAGLFITIAANVQDVASEMRHIHIGSNSEEEEKEEEEEEEETKGEDQEEVYPSRSTGFLVNGVRGAQWRSLVFPFLRAQLCILVFSFSLCDARFY